LKDFLHTAQVYGRSSLCMVWCVFRWSLRLNDLLHTAQVYGKSSPCTSWPLVKTLYYKKKREKQRKWEI
jgi:hypothetical protein